MRFLLSLVMLSSAAWVCNVAKAQSEGSQDSCVQDSRRVIAQYNAMVSHPDCRVPPNLRWQNDFQKILGACRVLPSFIWKSEMQARDDHLRDCGGLADLAPKGAAGNAVAVLNDMLSMPPDAIDEAAIPPGLVVCEGDSCQQGNQSTWIFQGTSGIARAPKGQIAKLTILHLDATHIVVRREDATTSVSPGYVAVYDGAIRGERIDGAIRAAWPGHFPGGKPPGVIAFRFFATIPETSCKGMTSDRLKDPFEIGQTAVRFRQQASAFECFKLAATQGNALAKGVLGLMYRDGIGVPASPRDAFTWAAAGAAQDDYTSEVLLAQMYESGTGTSTNADMARTWRERAQRNPVILQQQAAEAERERMQQMAFVGLAAMVSAMATPDVVVVRHYW